jgi:hypothetical protein
MFDWTERERRSPRRESFHRRRLGLKVEWSPTVRQHRQSSVPRPSCRLLKCHLPKCLQPKCRRPKCPQLKCLLPKCPNRLLRPQQRSTFHSFNNTNKKYQKMLHPFLTEAGWMSNLNYFDNCFGLCSTVVLGHAQQYWN